MNNEIQLFNFNENPFRTIAKDGNFWFVAKDVCDVLEIQNHRDTLAKSLDDDEKGVEEIYTLGGNQKMLMVNESGLYSLIFRSNKPQAKVFRKWVTSEVLPALRKTGRYETPKLQQPSQQFSEPVTQAIITYLDQVGAFKGTPTQLHWRLGSLSPKFTCNNIDWPRSVSEFGERLNKITPFLATQGIELERLPRTSKGHQVSIRRSGAIVLEGATNEVAELRLKVLEQALEIRRLKSGY